jgi:hypothetical protein
MRQSDNGDGRGVQAHHESRNLVWRRKSESTSELRLEDQAGNRLLVYVALSGARAEFKTGQLLNFKVAVNQRGPLAEDVGVSGDAEVA